MKKIIKDAMELFIITLVAGVLLGLVYMITMLLITAYFQGLTDMKNLTASMRHRKR